MEGDIFNSMIKDRFRISDDIGLYFSNFGIKFLSCLEGS